MLRWSKGRGGFLPRQRLLWNTSLTRLVRRGPYLFEFGLLGSKSQPGKSEILKPLNRRQEEFTSVLICSNASLHSAVREAKDRVGRALSIVLSWGVQVREQWVKAMEAAEPRHSR